MERKSVHLKHHNLYFGIPIACIILALYVYWFRATNRSIVFLVDHDMGPFVDSTAAFSPITRSRYWMTGLVADGAVMVLYLSVNITLRLINRSYRPPIWHSVWVLPAIAVSVGIPLILLTTTQAPPLPLGFTLWVTAVALAGLALALLPGSYAGSHPLPEVVVASVDGIGLSLILIGSAAIEEFQNWFLRGAQHFVILSIALILAGIALTLGMTGIRFLLKRCQLKASTLFLSGICMAYLGLSLLHHVLFTDGYFYISDSDNFFARNSLLQVGIWILTGLYCVGLAEFGKRLERRQNTGSR